MLLLNDPWLAYQKQINLWLAGLQLMNKYASYLLNDIVQMTPHLKQIKQYKHGEGFSIAGLTPWNWTQQPQTTSNQIVCKIYEANEINIWSVSLIDEAFICFWSFPPASQEGTIIVLHVPRVPRVLQNVVTEFHQCMALFVFNNLQEYQRSSMWGVGIPAKSLEP